MDDEDGVGLAGGEGRGVPAGRRPLGPGRLGHGWGGVRVGAVQPGTPPPRYGPEVEDAIVARVTAGESLHSVCLSEGMPSRQTVGQWVRRRTGFGARLEAAQRAAGRQFKAPASPFCEATFDAIFERLCQGEGMVAICRDPAMPAAPTVYRWMQAREELREAVALAREIHADRVGELAFDEAMAQRALPAGVLDARLRHLRWYSGRLAPVKYGTHKAQEPPKMAEAQVTAVTLRSFWIETREDGWRRVRGSHVDTETRRPVDEPPGEWEPPPKGSEEYLRLRAEAEATRRSYWKTEPGGGAGSADDDEQWV